MKYNGGGDDLLRHHVIQLAIIDHMHEIYGVHIYRDTPKRLLC